MLGITIHAGVNMFPTLAASIPEAVESALDHGVAAFWEVATPLTPVDTGALRGNTVTIVRAGEREMQYQQHYAIYQEFGTSHGVPASLFATKGADAATQAVDAALADWPNSAVTGGTPTPWTRWE